MALKGVLKKALLFKIVKWLLFWLQGVALTMHNCPHLERDCTLRFCSSEIQILHLDNVLFLQCSALKWEDIDRYCLGD